jgi:hypothetical protein
MIAVVGVITPNNCWVLSREIISRPRRLMTSEVFYHNKNASRKFVKPFIVVENIGVEPMTSSPKAFGARKRSIQLR